MVAWVKMLLELIWDDLCILIIKKDILIPGKKPTQGLDNTTLTAEVKYPINFTESGKRFVLSLQYNKGTVSHLLMLQKYIYCKLQIIQK